MSANSLDVGKEIGGDTIFIGAPESMHEMVTTPLTETRKHIFRLSPDDAAWLIAALQKELAGETLERTF